MHWIKKLNHTCIDGDDELRHHAQFGEDYTMRVGCSAIMCCFFSVTLLVRNNVRSMGALFEQALRCRLLTDVAQVNSVFHKGLLFQVHCIVLTVSASGRHNAREIASKDCDRSKSRRKSRCAPNPIDS